MHVFGYNVMKHFASTILVDCSFLNGLSSCFEKVSYRLIGSLYVLTLYLGNHKEFHSWNYLKVGKFDHS